MSQVFAGEVSEGDSSDLASKILGNDIKTSVSQCRRDEASGPIFKKAA